MIKKVKREGGFTLIEVLLSIALIGIIAGIAVPVYHSAQLKNDLSVAGNTIVRNLRRSQALSRSVAQDSQWGVKVQGGSVVIFMGTDYASRDSSFDENFELSPSITTGGIDEIVFDKLTGEPQSFGNITLSLPNGENKTITINEKGTINY